MKLTRLGYLIKEGFLSIFTHSFMSFACVMVIVACLLIMGVFSVISYVVDVNIKNLEQKNEILAFVDENLSDAEAREISKRIEAIDNVSETAFVSRQEAMENFINEHAEEDSDLFSDLSPSVFRNRYVIHLKDISLMDRTDDEIKAIKGVADTSASRELSRIFIALRNVVSIVSAILIIILFIVSVFIMQNTIKLATFSRREEIGIMKMVGASNSFIRCPFIIEGLILGLLGGAIAFFALWGIYQLACDRIITGLIAYLLIVPSFSSMMYPVLVIYLAVGLVVGTFGSTIAIRNYLKV